VYFGTRAVRNYRDAATTWSPDIDRLNAEFRHFLRARQIYLHRRHVNRAFVSAQHEESDIDMTVEAVGDFLRTHAGHLR
jgi:glutamate-1-semialdehyde aminotransferase